MTKEELKRLPFVAKAYQMIHPSNSCCEICGLPWAECKSKSININKYHGVFYVCQYCWDHNSLEDILKSSVNGYLSQFKSVCQTKHEKTFLKDHSLIDILEKVKEEYINTHTKIDHEEENKILQSAITNCNCKTCIYVQHTGNFHGVYAYCSYKVQESGIDKCSIDYFLDKNRTPYWCPLLSAVREIDKNNKSYK